MAVGRPYVEAAGLRELSSSGRRRRCWAVGEGCEADDVLAGESPTVLTLSHFSRPPFLCFGTVRVGTSRVRHLAVENPNAEPVRVAVCRPPPVSKGFTAEQGGFLLQPGERTFISVTWTPLEGGRVRELITFIVNDVVKHQAVLLGVAEQPLKKKKHLWDTIKKRTPALQSRCKKRLPIIKNVNATFQMSEKTDRGRSPLQSCENLEVNRDSISSDGNTLILLENKLSPISPILQENQNVTYTPLSTRRSTTYSVSGIAACDELLKDIKETCTVMPLCDYLVETKLETAHNTFSSVEAQSSNTNSVCTPEQLKCLQVPLNHRRILSPDSFVNNSYELTTEPATAPVMPILSPDQFLKENQIIIQATSQVPKSVSVSSSVESCMSRTIFPKQKEKMQVVTFSVEPPFSNKAHSTIQDRKMATPQYEKLERNVSGYRKTDKGQTCCFQKEQPKKMPVLSSTVTKSKPDPSGGKGIAMLKPKSRKCLSNAIQQCVDIVPQNAKVEMLPRLPVIEPFSGEAKCCKLKVASACLESTSYSRKRKSGEYLEDTTSGHEEYVENFETKKILMSCVENENRCALKTSVPKSVNREKQSQKKRTGTLSQKSKAVRRTKKNIVPVAQSHLTFVKPLKTNIPRHPMPFVARNMFYDERWKEKQQRGFTWWLNFVLTPDDFTVKMDTSQVNAASLVLGTESYHKSSVPKAPTKEEASLREYTARCKLNKLRRSACHLFTSDEMVKAIKRLEVEIEAKRLLVRKDRHLWKDIGERQKILNSLLCYNPLWLRIGLETVYGELIALESNSDVMGLAMFILNRLLWNPDIAAEYRHPTVPHLYRDGHEEALSRFTLKKLLLLVCFLDRAKLSRIIDHDPCLFCKNAEFKDPWAQVLAATKASQKTTVKDCTWRLVLNRQKLVLSNYPKPLGILSQNERKLHLLEFLELALPGFFTTEDLARVEYLYFNGLNARAVVTFCKWSSARMVYECRSLLWKNGVHVSRLFENWASPLPLATLPAAYTRSGQIKETLGHQNLIDFGSPGNEPRTCEDIGNLELWESQHLVECSQWLTSQERDELFDIEEQKLLDPFSALPHDAQNEIVNRLDLLKSQLTSMKVGQRDLNDQGTPEIPAIVHQANNTGRWERAEMGSPGKKICPPNCQVITEINPFCCKSNPKCTSNDLVPLSTLTKTATTTSLTWLEMRELDIVEMGSSKKAFNMGEQLFNSVGPIVSNSSKEILLAFSRDFLSGEGDLSRHLGFLGFPVNHVQMPLDEFDFAVTNLAIDLQCGIRLVRALELLSSDWSLSKKLRVPAISRLQKMHNVKIVLQVLKDRGIQLKDEHGAAIDTKDIVDRHREKTFALLWNIVFAFQVNVSLDMDQLKEEIDFLNMHATKAKTAALESSVTSKVRKDNSSFYSSESYSENVKLLMDWVNAVCRSYNIKVENFTVSFSDGRVLCCLIHHYHPCYVPLEAICQRTTQTVECTKSGTLALNSSSESDASLNLLNGTFDQTITTSVLYKELLDNEKKNFQLINAAVSDLGGVPAMIHHSDMSNTIPDEKVVITYVSFLCSRLLDLSKEIRAARLIQSAWRNHRLKAKLAQTKKQKFNATLVIQKHWRKYLAQMELQKLKKAKQEEDGVSPLVIQRWQEAAVVLQAWYRMKRERQHFLMMCGAAATIQIRYRAYREQTSQRQKFLQVKKAAVYLQATYRGYKLRQMLKCQNMAAVKIQAAFRAYTARMKYQGLIQASLVIQKWYRTSKASSKIRTSFLKTKMAVTSLQAALRGWQVRKWIRGQHAAAVTIQSTFRRYKALKRFRMVRNAALTLQQRYRAKVSSRKQWQQYVVLRNRIIQLQAAWRGSVVRKQIQRQHQAVVVIQSYYRMYINQTKFKRFRRAAVTVQRWYRAAILSSSKRQEYLALKEAAVKMQTIYRGMRARRKIQRMHQAAVSIQAMFKMHQDNVRYWAMKLSATIIQRRYRALCRGRKERENYLELRNASLILQAAYRGVKVRREVKTLHRSVTSIQSFYRMYRQRKSFQKLTAAAKLIQRWYRGCKDRNAQVHKYRQMKISILRIQSAFRGMKARLHLKKMHVAATIVQRRFRTFLQRQHFISLKAAAVTIQQKYRATALSKQQREEYLHLCKAAVMVQSTFRGQLVRKFVKRMHGATTIIQASFRMHIAYTQYRAMKLASVTIQKHYRAYREAKCMRELYLKQRHSTLVLQAAYRGMKTRHTLKKQHDAATVIQSNYRKHRQQCSYQKMQWAAKIIQIRVRANKLSKIAVQQYSSVKRAAICIQKVFRRMKARRCIKRHQAAIVLQRSFKMQRERRSYLAFKAATIVLQRRYRALILARRQHQEYISVRAAVVCVQSFYRGFKGRKEVECMHLGARSIQASFRMHRARLSYQRLRYAAVTIQNYYRSYLKRKHQQNAYLTFRKSAILVQATYRGMRTRQELKVMHVSATVIQSLYRMHVQCRHYKLIRCAVLTIQSAYRGAVARKKRKEAHAAGKIQSFCMAEDRRKFIQLRTAALALQSQYHANETREQPQKYWEAALLIQQHYRSYLTVKRQRLAYLQTLKNIIIIQAIVRGFIERRRLCKRKRSVIKMQAFFRGYKVRQLVAQNQSVFPQAWFIRCRTMKEYRAIEKATCVIQSYERAKQLRIWFLRMKASTILIQRKWRATVAAKITLQKFLAVKAAVVVIQSAYRRYSARKQFKKILEERQQNHLLHFTAAAYHHLAATRIQRAYRIHLHLKRAHLQLTSVLYIQRWYRAKLQRRSYLQYREKIIQLQRMVRRWMSCRNVAADTVQETVSQKTLSNGITKFQALWRGYSWRKKTDTAKTRALRDSLLIANKESNNEKKLCNRTALAIHRLLKYKHFSYILAALKDLEVVTRLSPVCCENMAQSEAVFTIFTLIRSCNRSVPCMDVIRYSVQVLLNLSKYERTTQAVYTVEKSVETLLDLLQMYRERAGDKISEKGGSIFTKTCCLFALLSKDSRRANEIRSSPRVVARLHSLFKLTARKHQMDAQRMLAKQKSGEYKNGHCSVSVTPVRTRLVSRQRPDWVLRKDNIQEIVDPLQAIEMVMDTLGISCS